MSDLYKFKASIIAETYYNPETQWGVYLFATDEDIPELFTSTTKLFDRPTESVQSQKLVGKMQRLYLGAEYIIQAKLEYSNKFSEYQYIAHSITSLLPKESKDKMLFLCALTNPDIANQLVESCPSLIEDIISGRTKKENFDTKNIKGLGKVTWGRLYDSIIENYVISDIITMLQPLGVSFNMIQKLITDQPNPTLLKQELIDNPYVITRIHGIGFKRADEIALKLNPNMIISNERLVAFINYYLKEKAEDEGHTWCSLAMLKSAVSNMMPECLKLFNEVIDNNNFLYIEDIKGKKRVGLKYLRELELNIFSDLINRENYIHVEDDNPFDFNENDIKKALLEAETEQGFTYTNEQNNIINEALNHNVAVISGVAGAGKSTIARAILKAYTNKGLKVFAMAMSAKAASRITETTGLNATTIHRGLGARGLNEFIYNNECPLPADLVFIDECSMINARMYWNLLSALKLSTRIILMGDALQLPPIGAGNIYLDILSNSQFHTFKLNKPMRQAAKSGILMDANIIRKGSNPLDKPEASICHGELHDMYYKFRPSREDLNKLAINVYMKSIQNDGIDNCIILTPRKNGCLNSSEEINRQIEELVIDKSYKKTYMQHGDTKFYVGAKVIQTVNNYESNVFNGEIGIITDIDIYFDKGKDKQICTVSFPDPFTKKSRQIEYEQSQIGQLELAYALTVHKYQGSEAKTVIGIIDNTHYAMLDSCLVYTLVTRAKGRCMILAEPQAFMKAIKTNHNTSRKTWLKECQFDEDGNICTIFHKST